MRQPSSLLAAALAFGSAAVAQQVVLAVRTSTVVQCVTATPGLPPICAGCAPAPTIRPPVVIGGPICVEIEAPECKRCGCDTCTQTVTYTTEYDAFCPTGITRQKYEVTETYKGVAAKPTIPSADVPLGFTKDVQTCTTCGPTPITATITRPVTEPQGTPVNGPDAGSGGAPGGGPGGAPGGGPGGAPGGAPGGGSGGAPGGSPDGTPGGIPGSGPGAVPSSGPGSVPGSNSGSAPGGSDSGSAPGAGSQGAPGSNAPGAVSTVVTADSRTIVPLAVGYAALFVSAFAVTAFFL
ncbi:hypothetical protein CTA2_190 [Colletotrichum tanaceti]|uniref:Uncharacterized protein n=1 Tax=Colletotrichum tanaceti TaxID=1306861 RepID=A0A4U6XI07_9PEZI|nr:hypothetical protein CTA2_190 [Colletotrichum tanaceti]TKW55485.1 hypothetical protein CTA1_6898 [Colletotrichum tanaceti]